MNEFLAGIELNREMGAFPFSVTYQDSCHLAHGQRVRTRRASCCAAVPGLHVPRDAGSDLCCGSAGIYNVVQNEMAMAILEKKMAAITATGADVIATANPGCMLQLQAGARRLRTRPARHARGGDSGRSLPRRYSFTAPLSA